MTSTGALRYPPHPRYPRRPHYPQNPEPHMRGSKHPTSLHGGRPGGPHTQSGPPWPGPPPCPAAPQDEVADKATGPTAIVLERFAYSWDREYDDSRCRAVVGERGWEVLLEGGVWIFLAPWCAKGLGPRTTGRG